MSDSEELGRVLLFTGDGKGKTTAALGLALRACGHGMRVLMLQLIKARPTGEVTAAKQLASFEIVQTGRGFVVPPSDPRFEEHRRAAQAGMEKAAQTLTSGRYDVLILDEVCTAVSLSLVDEKSVADLAAKRPPAVTLVLTGRGATPGLLALADTVTEMRCVKHGFESGRKAQKGVEF
jgi:cob(I)alamin adenosyltransferase